MVSLPSPAVTVSLPAPPVIGVSAWRQPQHCSYLRAEYPVSLPSPASIVLVPVAAAVPECGGDRRGRG